jgi:hypothetical protein
VDVESFQYRILSGLKFYSVKGELQRKLQKGKLAMLYRIIDMPTFISIQTSDVNERRNENCGGRTAFPQCHSRMQHEIICLMEMHGKNWE